MLNMRQSVKEVIKYALVGVVGLGVEWGFFFLIRDFFHLNYMIAHVVGCVCAIINNFVLNSYFTFKATDKIWVRAASFFTIAGIGLLFSILILPMLVKFINVSLVNTEIIDVGEKVVQNIAKLATTVVVAAMQFVFNKYFTFKKN